MYLLHNVRFVAWGLLYCDIPHFFLKFKFIFFSQVIDYLVFPGKSYQVSRFVDSSLFHGFISAE